MTCPEKPTNELLGFKEDEYGALSVEDIVIPPPPAATLSHDVPDKRLIITQLKIKNFKSYAGEVVLGPFDKNFTAVVGPNGSGKSNVIDSLLFVFGYRAKKIRSKKVSHLIHKSDQHPNVHSCSVTVHFATIKEEGDSYEIIPNTKFVFSRTAFSDDTSYYEMGNKRVPYKEMARALRQYGIDLEHSRFLILQGEIEAISLMHPKGQNEHECGMLEYIEDIIGTNRYIEPTRLFKEKVDKLNELKKEKLNNLKLVEKEKEDLEEPKNKAIEYLRLENRIFLNENSILHYKRFTARKEFEEIAERKKKLSEKLNVLKNEINEIKNSRKSQDDELQNIKRELEVNTKKYDECKEAYKSCERADMAKREEFNFLKAKKVKCEASLESLKTELVKRKKDADTYEKETAQLEKKKEKLFKEKNIEEKKLFEVMDSMKNKTNVLQEEKDKLEGDLLIKTKKVHNLKSEMDLLQSELDIYLRTDKKEKQALSDMISNYEEAEKSSKEEELLLSKEKEEISRLQTELESVMKQISESQQTESTLSEKLKNARLKYEEAKSSLSTFRNKSGMLQAFAKEKANGRLEGVYGRLGDLGAIDEKYDIAISTACGQLDNIVTDTLATAQKCVEFLKCNNLGYATFIPLEKMATWIPYAENKISTPENVSRLFDLVHVKDKNVLPAFYYALRDTLVADNLEQATRIGLQGSKRYRVVTLKGELIDLAGTMSGGGGRVFKGRMGQTVIECTHTPEDVSRINQEVNDLSKAVSDIRNFILNLQEQYSKKTRQLAGLQLSVKKRQCNTKAFKDKVHMLKIQIDELKKKMEISSIDVEKVDDLKEKIAQKQKSYQISSTETSAVQKKVLSFQEEILKVTKGSLSQVKKRVDQLTKEISDVSESITKSKANTKTNQRFIVKTEKKITKDEEELKAVDQTKKDCSAEREHLVNQAKEFCTKQKMALAALEKLKDEKLKLKKALDTFDEQEHQLKLAEIKQRNELKEQEALESEKQSFIRGYTAKITKLKLNEVENDPTEIPPLSDDDIEKLSIKRIASDSELLKVQLEEIKPDRSAIAEYKKKEKTCSEKQKDLDDTVRERNLQNLRYEELRKRRLSEFMKGFTAIAKKLKEIYQMLTLGGDAEMELVDTFDPFSKGIEFSVRPPKKSWKFMRNLSGGEKTLSSLALVFALHYYRPTPFYVMDEIDAALDVRNVAIVGYYLKERTKNTQFIIVSLRNIMNELADHLIGIFKTDNCSRNISIKKVSSWNNKNDKIVTKVL